MDRSLYARFMLHETPNIWYAAVGGDVTIDKSVRNLQRLSKRIEDERLSGLVIDYRAARLNLMTGEFAELAKRFSLYIPPYFQVAYLTNRRNAPQAALMIKLLNQNGQAVRGFAAWEPMTKWLGCPYAIDPIPRKETGVVLV